MTLGDAGPLGRAASILAEQSAALLEVSARLRACLDATRWRSPSALAARAEAEATLDRLRRCAGQYEEQARWYAAAASAERPTP